MPNTYSQLYYHYVFSPKYRESLISEKIELDLYKYITGITKNLNQTLLQINGMPDHIHILVRLRPTMAPSEFMQKIKSNSSKWINDNKLLRGKFFWQTGGGIFSVDYTRVDSVRKYIIDQKEHHKKRIFRSEYIELLEKYNIQYDSKYLLKFHDLD